MGQAHPTPRQLGATNGAALVVSSMVGTGIYCTSGFLVRDLGSPGLVLLAWAIGGLVATSGALTYGRLAMAIPRNGGEYVILSKLYHPAVGFVAGWISLAAGFVAPLAAGATAFSNYAWQHSGGAPKTLLALCAIWLFTALHLRGTAFGSKAQVIVTGLQLLLMTALIGVGLAWGEPSRLLFHPSGAQVSVVSAAFAHALVYVSYSYSGYNAAIYVAGEMKQPDRSLPKALIFATGLVTLLYVLLNAVYLASAPLAQLSGVVEIGRVAVEHLLGPAAGFATAWLVCAGLAGFISAMTFAGPRVLAAMSQDYPWCLPLSPKTAGAPPRLATLLQSVLASLLVLTASFEALLTYVGLMLSLSTLLAIVGVFRLGRIAPRYTPSLGISAAATLAALLLVWVIVATAILSPGSAVTALLTMLAAGVGYRWSRRHPA
jgi:basic amino acid/polyamine antiporter, APA family